MKILFVAVFTPNSTNVSQARGFEDNGCEVLRYDYRAKLMSTGGRDSRDNDLIKIANEFKPDIMVFSKCNNMHYRVVDECNKITTTVMWYMDAINNYDTELIDKIKRCDYFVCGVEGIIPHAMKDNKNCIFVNQCPDDEMNFMLDDFEYKYDSTFIGSADSSKIHSDRARYVSVLTNALDGFKHHNGVYGLEHNTIVNESKINLNFSPTDASGASVRVYKILASGGFLMTTTWESMDKTFTPNENIVIFKDEEDLIDKINYYLEHEEERNRIRLNGHRLVQQFLPKVWAKNIIDKCKNKTV